MDPQFVNIWNKTFPYIQRVFSVWNRFALYTIFYRWAFFLFRKVYMLRVFFDLCRGHRL